MRALDDFDGRVALITGASRGIGFAIAGELSRRGAAVVLTARKPDELERAVEALGERASCVPGSVGDDGLAELACAHALERHGRLDILINNAGTNPQYGLLHEADMGAVDKTLAVNLRAPLVWAQAAWTAALRDHGGTILNVASIGGLHNEPLIGAYNVSKAGLIHLTRQLALEMAPGVRVNAVAPAVVRTQFSRALYEGPGDPGAVYPLGRLGTVDDVAAAAAFLVSDEASWITGQALVLDGGASLAR